MFLSSVIVAPFVIAQAFAPAPADTAPPRGDTVVVRRDTSAGVVPVDTGPAYTAAVDTTPPARVAFDFGPGLGAPIAARALEFGVSSAAGATSRGQPATAARVRFVRAPDSLSAELARRVASGERIAAVDAQLDGRGGAPAVLLHLRDVQVVSTRLQMNDDNVGLVQQRLSLEESVAQISVDLQEARRQRGRARGAPRGAAGAARARRAAARALDADPGRGGARRRADDAGDTLARVTGAHTAKDASSSPRPPRLNRSVTHTRNR